MEMTVAECMGSSIPNLWIDLGLRARAHWELKFHEIRY